jgi:hypothetical protein
LCEPRRYEPDNTAADFGNQIRVQRVLDMLLTLRNEAVSIILFRPLPLKLSDKRSIGYDRLADEHLISTFISQKRYLTAGVISIGMIEKTIPSIYWPNSLSTSAGHAPTDDGSPVWLSFSQQSP